MHAVIQMSPNRLRAINAVQNAPLQMALIPIKGFRKLSVGIAASPKTTAITKGVFP